MGTYFCVAGKTAKIAKIRTRKNVVPHGSCDTIQKCREITSQARFAHGYQLVVALMGESKPDAPDRIRVDANRVCGLFQRIRNRVDVTSNRQSHL